MAGRLPVDRPREQHPTDKADRTCCEDAKLLIEPRWSYALEGRLKRFIEDRVEDEKRDHRSNRTDQLYPR